MNQKTIKSYKEFQSYKKGQLVYVFDYQKDICNSFNNLKDVVAKIKKIDKYGMYEISLNRYMNWY